MWWRQWNGGGCSWCWREVQLLLGDVRTSSLASMSAAAADSHAARTTDPPAADSNPHGHVREFLAVWEERVAVAQLRNKVAVGFNGTPQIHPQNCPFPFNDYHPIFPSATDPSHHPKRHPNPISHFATVNFPDTQTDWPTNRWDRRQLNSICSYARYIDRERRANRA